MSTSYMRPKTSRMLFQDKHRADCVINVAFLINLLKMIVDEHNTTQTRKKERYAERFVSVLRTTM